MQDDRAANQGPAFSLSFTLALYIRIGFGLNQSVGIEGEKFESQLRTHLRNILGTRTLSEILAEREVISEEILKILDKV